MNPFSNSHTRRRTVVTLLLVWFFALGSGFANACLLQDSGTHGHAPLTGGPTTTAQAWRISPGHLSADVFHAENAGVAQSACLKVCSDGARTVVKRAASADVAEVAMAPPTVLGGSSRLAATRQAKAWLEMPDPSPGVPLRIRFARLML